MITPIVKSFYHLLFPHLCLHCGHEINNRNLLLCFSCKQNLPKTGFASIANNPVESIFFGRIELQAATSGFYFSKGSLVQELIHELKYKENQRAGRYLGRLLGAEIVQSDRFSNLDMIIPLPMHKSKLRKRGYNQAKCIAEGMSELLRIPVENSGIIKTKSTETQTKKDRISRWTNTSDVFHVPNGKIFENKKVLLVDDVVTTGATIEACGSTILECKGAQLFVATVAIA